MVALEEEAGVRTNRARLLSSLAVTTILTAGLLVVAAPPAFAACETPTSNAHTVGSVNHGNSQTFCLPAGTFNYTVWTNHGHGQKYVALWHSGATHLHCDALTSGSQNASCTKGGINGSHFSHHDVAGISCVDRFSDGHGFDCHDMEDSA